MPRTAALGWRSSSVTADLFPFKTLTGELERPAVLGDGAHDVIGRTRGDFGFYLQGHGHFCSHQASEMSDDLIGDLARVAADAGGIEGTRPRESAALSARVG